MTQTARTRTDARYRGVIYGIDILDHDTRQVVPDDYVGKTRQRGRARENQHRDDQPWSDLIVGSSHVLWEGICTETELDEMERRFIQDVERRPRMNWKLNEDNPRQIPKWVQVEQRHARDDAAGRPRWVPLDQRDASSLLAQPMTVRSVPAMSVRRVSGTRKGYAGRAKRQHGHRRMSFRSLAASWSAAWLMIAAMTLSFVVQRSIGDASQRAWIVGLVPTGFVAFGHWLGPQAWKCLKRSIRRRIRGVG